jgi:hypothetical protein
MDTLSMDTWLGFETLLPVCFSYSFNHYTAEQSIFWELERRVSGRCATD